MKKKILYLLPIFLCLYPNIKAQVATQIAFDHYQAEPEEVLTTIAPNGHIFRGDNVDLIDAINNDTFILKAFDQDFNLLQQTEIGGYILHSAMAADGDQVFLNLQLYNVNNYPVVLPGVGIINTEGFLHGTVLLAFDHNLNLQWYHFFGANQYSGFWDCDIVIRNNGHILTNIFQDDPDDFVHVVLKEMDENGAVVNEMTQNNLVYTITEDIENSLYIAGSCAQLDANFNGTEVAMTNDYNFYIVKYDANGNYVWSNFVEEITCSVPDITVVSPEEIFLCVSMINNTYSFDNHTVTIDEYIHFVVTKINGDGQFDWVKTVSRNTDLPGQTQIYRNSFLTSDRQYLYLAGNVQGSIEWNNGVSLVSNRNAPFLAQLDLEGNVQWVETASNVTNYAEAHQLKISPTNELILSGSVNGSMHLDTVTISGSDWSAWMTRILPYGNPTFMAETETQQQWRLYPNPATEVLLVDAVNPSDEPYELTIYNLNGVLMKKQKTASILPAQVQLKDMKCGTYLLNISSSKESVFLRFIIE